MTDFPIDKIKAHREDAIARLTSQYDDATNLLELVGLFADRYQGLENVNCDLLTRRFIDGAQGVQLDELGEIVGEPRLNRDDFVYREAIRIRIILNRAGGEPEAIIRFVQSAFGADVVAYQEMYPAKVEVYARLSPSGPSEEVLIGNLELDDGELLILNDGSPLELRVLDRGIFGDQVDRLRDIVAAGVGTVYFLESDTDIALGTADVGVSSLLAFDDDVLLELDDGSPLRIIDAGVTEDLPDYLGKVGELGDLDDAAVVSELFEVE